jgi:pantothenate synthetase
MVKGEVMTKREEDEVLAIASRNVAMFEELAQAADLPASVREECRRTAQYNRRVVEEYQQKRQKGHNNGLV